MYHKEIFYNPRLGGSRKNPLLVMPLLFGHTNYTKKLTITNSRCTNSNTRPRLERVESPLLVKLLLQEHNNNNKKCKNYKYKYKVKLSKFKDELIQCKQTKGAERGKEGRLCPLRTSSWN